MNNFFIRVAAYLHGVWIHRWSSLAIATLVAFSGWFYTKSLPNVYRAQVSIYVEYRNPSVKAATAPDDLQSIIMNAHSLERIAAASQHTASEKHSIDERTRQLQSSLSFRSDNVSNSASRDENIDISYYSVSPTEAFNIIDTISHLFVQPDQSFITIPSNMNVHILEYPQMPTLPYSPNRPLLLSSSLLLAILAGLLWGIIRYRFSPFISDYRQLRKRIKRPVLGVVSLHLNQETFKKSWQDRLLFSFVSIGVILLMLFTIVKN
ncbi:MAG: hypothetical protein V3V12_09865 [Gammaproteobacteria bacterium]